MWNAANISHFKKQFYMDKVKNSLKPICFVKNIMMGCDPEFFFADKQSGQVIGSEKVLDQRFDVRGVIIDGVQAELNPSASYCRELLAGNISACFHRLQAQMAAGGIMNCAVKIDTLVDISQQELDSLSESSRMFGCAPSNNIYSEGKDKTSVIKADPKKYLKRSAGGHIHLGNAYQQYLEPRYIETAKTDWATAERVASAQKVEKALKQMPDTVVAVLDIVVGNTCVLLDRSAGNAERRANYGRAGEHRIKPYGVEYRTLSNFWLRSYPLMSFVTGLCRFAVHLVAESTPDNDYVKALFDAVPREDVIKAINTNDRVLALANWKKIQDIITAVADENTGAEFYPIRKANLKLFYHFILRIKHGGLEYWFREEPMEHWCGNYNARGGWESFAKNTIAADLSRYTIDLNTLGKEKARKAILPV